jgi:hypothetical protein
LTTIAQVILEGIYADIPAYGIPGRLYFATDTNITYRDSGSAWVEVLSGGTGTGTVTSVALTVPAILSVSGSPITGSGTLAVTLATETANEVFAGPASGSAADPTFRALAAADLPLATTGAFGAVKPDGSTITISAGVISSTALANPMTTEGDIIYGGASGVPTRLAAGTSGDVLQTNGSSSAPTWVTPSGGGGGGLFSAIMSAVPTQAGISLTTAYNQSGTFTATNNPTGITLVDTGTLGVHVEGILGTYPGSAFTLNALFSMPAGIINGTTQPVSTTGFAIVIANTTTGEALYLGLLDYGGPPWNIYVVELTNPTTLGTQLVLAADGILQQSPFVWLQLQDDGTSIYFRFSYDGSLWTQVYTVTKSSSYLGSGGFNYLGYAILPDGGPVGNTLMSWAT